MHVIWPCKFKNPFSPDSCHLMTSQFIDQEVVLTTVRCDYITLVLSKPEQKYLLGSFTFSAPQLTAFPPFLGFLETVHHSQCSMFLLH